MKTRKTKLIKASNWTLTFIMIAAGFGLPVFQSGHTGFAIAAGSASQQVLDPASASNDPYPELRVSIPENMAPLAPLKMYNHQNVFELINGQAELYFSAGFRRLMYQRIAKEGDPEFWIELFVYDMGSVRNAFAVFSMQRREDGKPSDLATFAYSLDSSLYLTHGPYYLEILASRDTEEAAGLMHYLAREFIRLNKVEIKPIQELSLFPRANLVEKSFTLIPSNVFGTEMLNQTYTARYKLGATDVTAFISPRKGPLEAKDLALKYYTFLKDYEAKDVNLKTPIEGARMVDVLDTYELIFTAGPYFAGIHEAPSREQAERLGTILAKRLKEVINRSISKQ